MSSIVEAVKSRDERELYEAALDDIAESIVETKSSRDKAALWKRLFEAYDRLKSLPDPNAKRNRLQQARDRAHANG